MLGEDALLSGVLLSFFSPHFPNPHMQLLAVSSGEAQLLLK
jgi:hypothetical protein